MSDQELTTFYIVRHGETDWNKNKIMQGQKDIPLNETGEQQAKDLAQLFKDIDFDLAFSSDLIRAKRTAEIVALEHQLTVETTKLLRERSFGRYEGQPSAALIAQIKLLRALTDDERRKHKVDDESESDEEVIGRFITFLRETAITHPGKTVLVGAHGGFFHVMLVHLGILSYPESDAMRIKNSGYIKLLTDGVDFFVKEIVGKEARVQKDI